MFPTELDQPQREAVLDLLLLGMFADDVVRLVENSKIYDLLSPFGWESYQTPQDYAQTATVKARAARDSAVATDAFLARVSERLAADDVRKLALALLSRLIEADEQAVESEADFYQHAKTAFGV